MKAIIPVGVWPRMHMSVGNCPQPLPNAHEVLVKVQASSVNPKDWKLNWALAIWRSFFGKKRQSPIFGDDLAGLVVACGGDAGGWKVGDSVYGMDMRLRTAALAEYAVINTRRIARMHLL